MTTETQNEIIERLLLVCGTPDHTPNVNGYFAEIDRLTKNFPANVLRRAGDRLVADAGRKWPTCKAILDAILDAQDAIAATNAIPKSSQPKYPWEVQKDQAMQWAAEWMNINPMGDQARREGWAREAKHYAGSFAWNTLRANRDLPPHRAYQIPADFVAYYRRTIVGLRKGEI